MTQTVMDQTKNAWMVMTGQPVDSIDGGGFEFFGPFATHKEADAYRKASIKSYKLHKKHLTEKGLNPGDCTWIVTAIQLLRPNSSFFRDELKRLTNKTISNHCREA